MYFEETLVMQCIQNLSYFFPCSNLYFERISTLMCKNSNKQKSVSNTKALFKWGVDDPCTIENGLLILNLYLHFIIWIRDLKDGALWDLL